MVSTLRVSTRVAAAPAVDRAAASGEVGLLGEEAAQRLLAIFAEAGAACLRQIHALCAAHADSKYEALLSVGLDLVLKWDADVVHEEAVRLETAYPEVPTLHSYVHLWLLDRLCSDVELGSLSVPPVNEAYAGFMKRLVAHADVRAGVRFTESPELYRRTVYVDCFRGAYHDLLQRRGTWAMRTTSRRNRPARADPGADEAASQVGLSPSRCGGAPRRECDNATSLQAGNVFKSAVLTAAPPARADGGACESASQVWIPSSRCAAAPQRESENPTSSQSRKVLNSAMMAATPPPALNAAPQDVERLRDAARPSSAQSLQTKAIAVASPCFFGN